MPSETQVGAAAARTHATDGIYGKLAVGGLVVLAVCLVVVSVATTLQEAKSTPIWEGPLTRLICFPPRVLLLLGALAGGLVCTCSLILSLRDLARGRPVWAGMFLLAAGAAGTASHALLWGACTGAGVADMPLVRRWESRLSLIALAVACAVWAFRAWWAHSQRVAQGDLRGAEARIGACLAAAAPPDLLVSLPGMFLSATVFCLLVCVPAAWVALTDTYDPGGGVFVPVVLSGSGTALFCLLQCVVLAGVLALMIALARCGWAAGRMTLAIGIIAGTFAFGFCLWGASESLGANLVAFGFTPLVWVLLLVGGLLYGVAVPRYVLELCRDPRRPRDPGDLIRVCILAGLLLPVLTVVRWVRGRVRPGKVMIAAACLAIGLIIAYVLPKLFPREADFLSRIRFFLVAFLILLTVLLGCLLTPWKSRFWQARLGALGAIVAASVLSIVRFNDAMAYARPKVLRNDIIGRHSLRVVEGVLPPSGRKAASPAGWAPPAILGPPTRRRAVMDELKKKRPLTIVIILDACRPDRMSIYGYRRKEKPLLATTPNLDRHKDAFLRFTTAFSPASSTTCAMRHLFTGRYSSRWMLKTTGIAPFWTNDLIRAGYHTFFLNIIGYDNNGISTEAFRRDMPREMRARTAALDCAWCTPACKSEGQPTDNPRASDELLRQLKDKAVFLECNQQCERTSTRHLLNFLDSRRSTRGRGVFAYIHFDMTHSPWGRLVQVPDFGPGDWNRFDESVRFSDWVLGDLIEGLKKLQMWDQTILMVTADHGTILIPRAHEHYQPYHNRIRIPLLLKIPGVPGRQIDPLVSLFDFGPTLVDVFSPDTLRRYEGRSLWPLIFGDQQWEDRVLLCLSAFANCYGVVHSNGWQYIHHRGEHYEQLYNWRKDPDNQRDRTGRDKEATRQTRRLMSWFLYEYGKGRTYTNPFHYRGPP